MRFNEHAASWAAAECGVSPAVRHVEPGLMVIDFVAGMTLTPERVRADLGRCVDLVRRAHREVTAGLRGPALSFNVFHVLRDYGHTLRAAGSSYCGALPRLGEIAARLEAAVGPVELVLLIMRIRAVLRVLHLPAVPVAQVVQTAVVVSAVPVRSAVRVPT